MAENALTEGSTPEEVASWLQENGIPEEHAQAFIDNYIDGEEFIALTEGDVSKMVKPIGLVKKISRLIRKISPDNSSSPQLSQPAAVSEQEKSPQQPDSGHGTQDRTVKAFQIPEQWSEETMECIAKEVVTPAARKEIVQTLATMLRSRQLRPTRDMCSEAAEMLVLKYPFMQDPFGKRYASWLQKIMEHLNNRRKYQSRKTRDHAEPPEKRHRLSLTAQSSRIHRYPVIKGAEHTEERDTMSRHLQEMKKEMQRAKPRDAVLLQLMESTFQHRRDRITDGKAQSIREVLDQFPALKRPAVVKQDMDLIMQQKGITQNAAKSWRETWIPAILEFGRASQKSSIQSLLEQHTLDETDGDKVALQVLASLYLPKSRKFEDNFIHIYEEYEMSTTMEEACMKEPLRTSPRVAAFTRENATEYYLFAEQDVFCEAPNLTAALILWFSLHYVFDLEYSKPVKEIGFFFQDVVFLYPDQTKRPSTYLATTGDIKRFAKSVC